MMNRTRTVKKEPIAQKTRVVVKQEGTVLPPPPVYEEVKIVKRAPPPLKPVKELTLADAEELVTDGEGLTVDKIERIIAALNNAAASDVETAHILEDKLYQAYIQDLVNGDYETLKMAQEIGAALLRVRRVRYSRSYNP